MALDFQCPQHHLVFWKILKNLSPSQWYILDQKYIEFLILRFDYTHFNAKYFEFQTLKRRSFVLDDEVGSVGSIRRIRQKSNIIASGFRNTDRVGSDSDVSQVSLKQKLLMNGNSKHVQRTVEENADFNIPSTSYALVPLKSNGVEGAGRRSGNLEKRPLKDRSSESNMVAVRQKSTFQLTPSMLRGQALRSMEEASTSELLHSVQDDHNIEASAGFMDADDHTSQDQGKVEEDGPVENAFPSDTHNPINNSDSAVSFEADIVRGRTSDDLEVGLSEPQNKAAFRMSALEVRRLKIYMST